MQEVGCVASTWDMYDTYNSEENKQEGMFSKSFWKHEADAKAAGVFTAFFGVWSTHYSSKRKWSKSCLDLK